MSSFFVRKTGGLCACVGNSGIIELWMRKIGLTSNMNGADAFVNKGGIGNGASVAAGQT
jgi:hypothetical protein